MSLLHDADRCGRTLHLVDGVAATVVANPPALTCGRSTTVGELAGRVSSDVVGDDDNACNNGDVGSSAGSSRPWWGLRLGGEGGLVVAAPPRRRWVSGTGEVRVRGGCCASFGGPMLIESGLALDGDEEEDVAEAASQQRLLTAADMLGIFNAFSQRSHESGSAGPASATDGADCDGGDPLAGTSTRVLLRDVFDTSVCLAQAKTAYGLD